VSNFADKPALHAIRLDDYQSSFQTVYSPFSCLLKKDPNGGFRTWASSPIVKAVGKALNQRIILFRQKSNRQQGEI
jgi:hypothetical protein